MPKVIRKIYLLSIDFIVILCYNIMKFIEKDILY